MPTLRAGGGDTVAGSLGDEAPFELRDRAEDMEDQFAGGRGGVDLFFKGEEPPLVSYKDKKGKYQGQVGVTLPKL